MREKLGYIIIYMMYIDLMAPATTRNLCSNMSICTFQKADIADARSESMSPRRKKVHFEYHNHSIVPWVDTKNYLKISC
jgi:hypothetical protein